MLDELYKAAAAIEGAGISTKDWHPKFKTLPKVSMKAPCIRIWLDTEGHVADLEPLTAKHAAELRKFEPDNGKSFPGFNIRPLFIRTLPEEVCKKFAREAADRLKMRPVEWSYILADAKDLWMTDTIKTVERILVSISADLKKKCIGLRDDETLAHLFNAVEKMEAARFQEEFHEKLKMKIEEGILPLSTLLFLGQEGKESKTSVFFDVLVKDYSDFPVAHEKTIARLNDLLLAGSVNKGSRIADEVCKDAYGEDSAGSDNLKMAQVSVPVLGGVLLRSQAKEIPAQSRYDLCEGETCIVGNATRASVKRALEWLADTKRNGRTYGIAGDKELLFAYPAHLPPDSCPELALLLGAQSDDERKFSDLAESVIGQLKGTGKPTNGAVLEIFSLRKMDKARTKVVYYRNTTVSSLETASREWDAGFKNIPQLNIRTWSDEKNENGKSYPVHVAPRTHFPVRIHKILNSVWTLSRNEIKQSKVKLFEPSTGLRLLLDTPEATHAAYVAERFLAHSQTYFIVLCRTMGRGEITALSGLDAYPGVLGLLLYKLGKTKENYMNESAFQLGRFLRVADEIHRLYCEVVRNREIPPELCGSSMLAATLESPTQALAQLCMRAAPYLKWAHSYHGSDVIVSGGKSISAAKLVHSWMQKWSPIADMLHQTSWPARPTPEERAQIFLGFLSSFPKSEKPETSTESTESAGE